MKVYSAYYKFKLNDLEKQALDYFLEGYERHQTHILLPGINGKTFLKIWKVANLDYPELFYVSFKNVKYLEFADRVEAQVTYLYTKKEELAYKQRIEKEAAEILKGCVGMTDAQKALYLHDMLLKRSVYGTLPNKETNAHNLIGPFLDKVCVCEGYAKAYKYLCDLAKVRCIVIFGNATPPDKESEGHAWNIVRLDGHTMHVDVTFDKIIEGTYCSRAYFCLSSKEIAYDHTPDPEMEIPDCPVSGSLLATVSGTRQLMDFLKEEHKKHKKFSEIRMTKGFTNEKLMDMIKNRLTPLDYFWYSQIKYIWYGNKNKTVCVSWK